MRALAWLEANADQIATVFLAIVMGIAVRVGIAKGNKVEAPKLVELAGAVINSADVKTIVASTDANTAAVYENTAARTRGDMAIRDQLDEVNARLERINEKFIECIVMMRQNR